MNRKTAIILGVIVVVALSLVGVSTYFLTQNQNNQSNANTPTPPIIPPTAQPLTQNLYQTSGGAIAATPSATETPSPTPTPTSAPTQNTNSCQTPSPATGVQVKFPYVDPSTGQAIFVQASCNWNAAVGAASYAVTVTEVETNTIVMQQNIPAGTTLVSFNINQGKTYKCDVSVVNACGAVSSVSSDQLLCSANGLVETPTPTPTPVLTATPVASSTPTLPLATATPRPTLAATGSPNSIYIGVGLAAAIIMFGGFLFVL